MPTANERRALWFFAIVALSGSIVRLIRARSHGAAAAGTDAPLERQLTRVDSVRALRGAPRKPGPSRDRSRGDTPRRERRPPDPALVDLDRASAKDIEALPGIGPSLASRIVAHRDSVGGFGTMAAFCRVRGVGQALAERLRLLVIFSGNASDFAACEAAPSKQSKSHVINRGKAR